MVYVTTSDGVLLVGNGVIWDNEMKQLIIQYYNFFYSNKNFKLIKRFRTFSHFKN